ncbi:CRAL-TRIO domain [Pseudocohnilembus persalinus]|uniref:CRAL-TRIO domain n=1 Tax=Pseudocohnilembus persalinus TaxID=266149 RepID=A0A0V0QBH9_PSEPJ|nr:CRAL-TRIO domain [Pseudocohnilembus persalinus]|eukprot:KRW99487.1 CRAL-TRIO domain [Pseudocohnilembus persalinus]
MNIFSDAQLQQSISPKEQEVLNQFRDYVQKQFLYEQGSGELGQSQAIVDDAYLLRFLKARKFDFNKTLEMWNNTQKWRQENQVDTIISDFTFNELPEVKKHYPHGYHKTDKQGRPVYIERVGSLNLKNLFEQTTEERLIKYYIQSYEILLQRIFPACSVLKGEKVDQTVTILDLKGASMKMMSKTVYNFIQLASKVAQDNYPEILGRMFIVNAPMLFTGIWQIIKPWLDEKTRNKITIMGGKYKEKLLELIDAENLPDFLGGTSKCEGTKNLENNIGCWNPDAQNPLYPGEPGYTDSWMHQGQELEQNQNNEEGKQIQDNEGDEEEEEDENQNQDLDQLKNALLGMGIGGQGSNKPSHNPNKYDGMTQGNQMVSDTPLNTQINDEADDYDNPY